MVVIITGASAGIGKALAEALAARGARLALAARRVERLDALNVALGGGHLVVPTDVSDRGQCEALVRRSVEHYGRAEGQPYESIFGPLDDGRHQDARLKTYVHTRAGQ